MIYWYENTTCALYGYSVRFWHSYICFHSELQCKGAHGFFWRWKKHCYIMLRWSKKKYRKSIRFIDCIHLSFFKTLHPQMQDIPSDLGCVTLYIFLIVVCVWLNSRGFWFMHIENIQRSLRSSEKRKTAFLLNGLSLSTWKTQISVIYFPT